MATVAKRLLSLAPLLLAVSSGAQTYTTVDAATLQSGVTPVGMVVNWDQFNSEILKNGILSPGFERAKASILIQVGQSALGSATYFNDFNDFAMVPTNEASSNSAIAQVIRNGAVICVAPVVSNNVGDSLSATFTGVLTGGSLTSITPATAIINGLGNGSYPLEVHSGGGSGATAQIVVTGATLGASGYTGGTATPAVTAGGTGYTSTPKINVWNGFTLGACTTGAWTGGATVGDFVNMRWDYGPSTQAMFNAMGWGFSGSGTATGSTDVPPASLLPAGMQDQQSMQVVGPLTVGGAFDTGEPAGQNLYQLIDPIQTEISAKETAGSGVLSFNITRLIQAGGGSVWSCSGTLTVTGSWQKFSNYATSFGNTCPTGETDGSNAGPTGPLQFSFSVPAGSTILLDNAFIGAASTGNTTAFRDEAVTALANYGGGTRVLDNQMPLTMLDSLQPDTRGVPSYTFGDNCNEGQPLWSAGCINAPPITIPMHQNLCLKLGTDCLDVVGVDLFGPDAVFLADFEGGACTVGYPTCTCATPGATQRCSEGQTTPYTQLFAAQNPKRKMGFELGNENWNTNGSGAKWRGVPLCTAGPNCAAEYANGTSTAKPYGMYVQDFAAAFEADPNYDATTQYIVFGAQTSGGNTTFGLDNLFKVGGTSTPGTPFVTAPVTIEYAPYIGFSPTQTGFDANDYSNQLQSDFANVYWTMDNSNGAMHIPALAYPNPVIIYEFNGGQTGQGFATITQPQEAGYQGGSMGAGIVQVVNAMEACKTLAACGFEGLFVLQQQQQTFNLTTPVSLTGTSANASNVITGVTITPDFAIGQNFHGPGLGSSVDATGSAGIWAMNAGAGTVTLSKNISCATTCGSQTWTLTTAVTNLWGTVIGMGAQRNNQLRGPYIYMQAANKARPYGTVMTSTTGASIPSFTFPPTGNCGTSSNTAHALSCNGSYGDNPIPNTISGIPLTWAWSFKGNPAGPVPTFRSHVYLNEDNSPHSIAITGSPLAGTTVTKIDVTGSTWRGGNETAGSPTITAITSSTTMPASLTLQPGEMVVFTGSTTGAAGNNTSRTGTSQSSGTVQTQ